MDQEEVQNAIRIARLIYQKNQGELTAVEEAELRQRLLAHPENSGFYEELARSPEQEQMMAKLTRFDAEASLKETMRKIEDGEGRRRKHRQKLLLFAITAAALLFIPAITFYFFNRHDSSFTNVAVQDILPGGNRATLTFADGRKVPLDSAQNGIIVSDRDIQYSNGNSVLPVQKEEVSRANLTFTLTTPRGGQYQIILADGTKVWLNAASVLKYPSRFTGDTRTVALEGEAYFAVNNKTADPHAGFEKPFIVKTRNQQTVVLGTEFNINAYDPVIVTSLVSGAIQVKANNVMKLVPGEQSIVQKDGNISKAKADIKSDVVWRQGLFNFRDASIQEVMRQLSRWYDVDIVYQGPAPKILFTGEIPRSRNASEVLRMLEFFDVKFNIEGKKIIVIKPENNKNEKNSK